MAINAHKVTGLIQDREVMAGALTAASRFAAADDRAWRESRASGWHRGGVYSPLAKKLSRISMATKPSQSAIRRMSVIVESIPSLPARQFITSVDSTRKKQRYNSPKR